MKCKECEDTGHITYLEKGTDEDFGWCVDKVVVEHCDQCQAAQLSHAPDLGGEQRKAVRPQQAIKPPNGRAPSSPPSG